MSRLSIEIKEKALNLRSKGYSVKEIADKLGIAKGTSSLWVRHIKLNKKAQQRLKERRLLGYYKISLHWQEKRIKRDEKYKLAASKVINKIKRDFVHTKTYCSLLYWCEGGKSHKLGVRFVNSDPVLISTFLNLFRKSFEVDERKFRVLMHLHDYHDEENQKKFWSKLTKIPRNQFLKSFHKTNTKKRIKENYPGCIAIHYYDVKVVRELKMLYRVFSEQLGT